MYSKIVNPKTGRKVSITGRLGKTILRNYFNVLNGGSARDATLTPDFLVGLSNITISVMSLNKVAKGEFMIDNKAPLSDLVDRIIELLNTSDDHWNIDNLKLIRNGEEIWPTGADGTLSLQEIGVIMDSTIYYMEHLLDSTTLTAAAEIKDAEEAEGIAKQRALDEQELDQLEDQMEREWSPSDFGSDDDEVNEFARHFRGPPEVVVSGAASKTGSDSDTSLEALIASFEEDYGDGTVSGDNGVDDVESEDEDSIPSLDDLIAQFEAETDSGGMEDL